MFGSKTKLLRQQIQSAAIEVQSGVNADTDFSSHGIRDGQTIVEDYLRHGEFGLALEHVIYMVTETDIEISIELYDTIDALGKSMGLPPETWSSIRHSSGAT